MEILVILLIVLVPTFGISLMVRDYFKDRFKTISLIIFSFIALSPAQAQSDLDTLKGFTPKQLRIVRKILKDKNLKELKQIRYELRNLKIYYSGELKKTKAIAKHVKDSSKLEYRKLKAKHNFYKDSVGLAIKGLKTELSKQEKIARRQAQKAKHNARFIKWLAISLGLLLIALFLLIRKLKGGIL
jgi:hypothetical protein